MTDLPARLLLIAPHQPAVAVRMADRTLSLPVFVNGVVGRAVLIGLPIALVAARSVHRRHPGRGAATVVAVSR